MRKESCLCEAEPEPQVKTKPCGCWSYWSYCKVVFSKWLFELAVLLNIHLSCYFGNCSVAQQERELSPSCEKDRASQGLMGTSRKKTASTIIAEILPRKRRLLLSGKVLWCCDLPTKQSPETFGKTGQGWWQDGMVTEAVRKWEGEMGGLSKTNSEQVEHVKLIWILPGQEKMLSDQPCLSIICKVITARSVKTAGWQDINANFVLCRED